MKKKKAPPISPSGLTIADLMKRRKSGGFPGYSLGYRECKDLEPVMREVLSRSGVETYRNAAKTWINKWLVDLTGDKNNLISLSGCDVVKDTPGQQKMFNEVLEEGCVLLGWPTIKLGDFPGGFDVEESGVDDSKDIQEIIEESEANLTQPDIPPHTHVTSDESFAPPQTVEVPIDQVTDRQFIEGIFRGCEVLLQRSEIGHNNTMVLAQKIEALAESIKDLEAEVKRRKGGAPTHRNSARQREAIKAEVDKRLNELLTGEGDNQ